MTSEEIKQFVTMNEVLSRYGIKTRKNMCSCPFHGSDKHPSMQIFKDGYKCHTCGSHGDIFSFVMEYERVDFKTAFQILGGTYEHQEPLKRKAQNTAFQREREEKKRAEEAETDFKRELSRAITICRKIMEICDPESDLFGYAAHWLPWLLWKWETKYIDGKEVNEIDVFRACRAIKQRIYT